MKVWQMDTDEGLYEEDDKPYQIEELMDFKGELQYPYDYGNESEDEGEKE